MRHRLAGLLAAVLAAAVTACGGPAGPTVADLPDTPVAEPLADLLIPRSLGPDDPVGPALFAATAALAIALDGPLGDAYVADAAADEATRDRLEAMGTTDAAIAELLAAAAEGRQAMTPEMVVDLPETTAIASALEVAMVGLPDPTGADLRGIQDDPRQVGLVDAAFPEGVPAPDDAVDPVRYAEVRAVVELATRSLGRTAIRGALSDPALPDTRAALADAGVPQALVDRAVDAVAADDPDAVPPEVVLALPPLADLQDRLGEVLAGALAG